MHITKIRVIISTALRDYYDIDFVIRDGGKYVSRL